MPKVSFPQTPTANRITPVICKWKRRQHETIARRGENGHCLCYSFIAVKRDVTKVTYIRVYLVLKVSEKVHDHNGGEQGSRQGDTCYGSS